MALLNIEHKKNATDTAWT